MNTQNRSKNDRQGLVQVYTGNGKGKTTAALGLALRAVGHGWMVYIGQFLKSQPYGEHESVSRLAPNVVMEQYGVPGWMHKGGATPEQLSAAQSGLGRLREAMLSGLYDLVIADEINIALAFGVLDEQEVLELIQAKPPAVELVLTGRQAPASILAQADLVTEMKEVQHPYQQGILAREGIEF